MRYFLYTHEIQNSVCIILYMKPKEHKILIDNFININIISYQELAKKIIESIVFTDFKEECYIEENILKHLVESFIRNNSINLKKK